MSSHHRPAPHASPASPPLSSYSTLSPAHHQYRKAPRIGQRDSLASTVSTLPLYQHELAEGAEGTGAPPPDYDSSAPSSSPSRSKDRARAPSPSGSSASASRHSHIDLTSSDDEDEPDALDLLIQRTSLILSTSQSILASTLSSRAHLARFFELDDNLQVEGDVREGLDGVERAGEQLERLRSEVEDYAEGRSASKVVTRKQETVRTDPRELLLKRQSHKGHPPRVATQHEEGSALPSPTQPSPFASPSQPKHQRSASSLLLASLSASSSPSIRGPAPLKPSPSAASLVSILESSSSSSTGTTRRLSISTNPTSPEPPSPFQAIHEEISDHPSALPPSPSTPSRRRILHTRSSASVSLSSTPLPSSLFASPSFSASSVTPADPSSASKIRHHRASSSSVSRPPPSPSGAAHGHSGSKDDLSRVHVLSASSAERAGGAEAGGGAGAARGLRERLEAARGVKKEEKEEGGGWWGWGR